MKRTLTLLVTVFACILTFVSHAQYPTAPESITFANDFADMLDDETKKEIEKISTEYNEKTTIEMVVVTVNSLHNIDPDSYATNLFNQWRLGKATLNNGILLLISKNDRKLVIKPGKGLEMYYKIHQKDLDKIVSVRSDGVMSPHFRRSNYDEGVLAGLESIQDIMGDATWNMREEHYELQQKKLTQARLEKRENELLNMYSSFKGDANNIQQKIENTFVTQETKEVAISFIDEAEVYTIVGKVIDNESSIVKLARKQEHVHYRLDTEINEGLLLIKKQERKILYKKICNFFLLLIILSGLGYLLWKRKKRLTLIKQLDDRYYNEILEPLNKYDSFFTEIYKLPSDPNYPKWAMEKLKKHLHKGVEITKSIYSKASELDELIQSDPYSARENFFIPDLSELETHYTEITDSIPNLVRKYKNETDEKVNEAQLKLSKSNDYFVLISERGFNLSDFQDSFSSYSSDLESLQSRLESEKKVYKNIYEDTEKLIEKIATSRKGIENIVSTQLYVEESIPNIQEYVQAVKKEYLETISFWEALKEYPITVYQDLVESHEDIDEKFKEIDILIQRAIQDNSFTDQDFFDAKKDIDSANNTIQWLDTFLDKIRERHSDVLAAKKNVFHLFSSTNILAKKALRKSKHSDVSSSRRRKANDLIAKLSKFEILLESETIDWLLLQSNIQDVKSESQSIINKSKNDIASAEAEREAAEAARRRREARRRSSSSYSSSSYSSSPSSSSFGGGSSSFSSGSVGGW